MVKGNRGNTNLDTITQTGIYFAYTNAGNGPSLNFPSGTNGWLIVLPWWSAENVHKQVFMRLGTPGTNDGETYIRTSDNSGQWGKWWKVATA